MDYIYLTFRGDLYFREPLNPQLFLVYSLVWLCMCNLTPLLNNVSMSLATV